MDYYGRRLATGSSDRTIRIFLVEPNQPEKFVCALTGLALAVVVVGDGNVCVQT